MSSIQPNMPPPVPTQASLNPANVIANSQGLSIPGNTAGLDPADGVGPKGSGQVGGGSVNSVTTTSATLEAENLLKEQQALSGDSIMPATESSGSSADYGGGVPGGIPQAPSGHV